MNAQVLPDDGYADGGEPYSDEEMDWIEQDTCAICREEIADGETVYTDGDAVLCQACASGLGDEEFLKFTEGKKLASQPDDPHEDESDLVDDQPNDGDGLGRRAPTDGFWMA